jgi:hypothetical protein
MRYTFLLINLIISTALFGQSKSITRFRSDFKENSNMFFYSSTLKMLNADNNPEIADIINDIEEIRVLNYNKAEQKFKNEDIAELKNSLTDEEYNVIMMVNEKGNVINLYNREKKGKTVGFVALVENTNSLVLIDLIGSIDVKKFMELKQKLDIQKGIQFNKSQS